MSRVAQPVGQRGSLKWIQRAVAHHTGSLQPIGMAPIQWVSPLAEDDFAEYRDGSFLTVLGLEKHIDKLKEFWPARRPQWDALGVTEDGGIVLVEAKAHLAELVSPPTQASPVSRAKIEKALAQAKSALGVDDVFDWTAQYYQLANRIAHLWFLRDLGENAHLLLVDFMGDEEMAGPMDRSGWYQAYDNAHCTLGLPDNHLLTPYIHHVFPAVGALNVPVEDRRAIK